MNPQNKIDWTDLDEPLRRMRAEGQSWWEISDRLGVAFASVLLRARALKIPTKRISRGPMSGKRVVALKAQQHDDGGRIAP